MTNPIDCCNLVGSLDLGPNAPEGIISINYNSSTDLSLATSVIGGRAPEVIVGPTIASVSISAYANTVVHTDCAGRAGVTINWLRKYDCVNNKVYFIFAGEGKSYSQGGVGSYVTLRSLDKSVTYRTLQASASSGPASIYQREMHTDSFGLVYTGRPWPIDTSVVTDSQSPQNGVLMQLDLDIITGLVYLQSFSIQTTPGQVPIANYEFLYQVDV